MGQDRLNGLALSHVQRFIDVPIDKIKDIGFTFNTWSYFILTTTFKQFFVKELRIILSGTIYFVSTPIYSLGLF